MAAIFHSSICWIEASAQMLSEDLTFFNSCYRQRDRNTPLQLSPDVRLLLALQIPRCTKDVPH